MRFSASFIRRPCRAPLARVLCLLLALSPSLMARNNEMGKDELADVTLVRPKPPLVQIAPVAAVSITPGKPSTVALDFRVPPGFHINSSQPRGDLLIPTAVKFDPPTDIVVGKLVYPPGRDLSFGFSPEKLNVYTGDFRVIALVSAARSMPRGTFRVRGTLKYQACDNKAFFPPTLVPLQFDVKVRKSSRHRSARNPGQSPHIHN